MAIDLDLRVNRDLMINKFPTAGNLLTKKHD